MTGPDDPPEVAKLVQLPADIGKRMAHLQLHMADLRHASECLDEHQRLCGGTAMMSVVCRALFHTALNTTMKCFGHSNARQSLIPKEIFSDEQERKAFDFLQKLRHKHISHDDNDWAQAIPYAAVTTPGHDLKIAALHCKLLHSGTNYPANIAQLRQVINTTMTWVSREIHSEADTIQPILESWTYEELLALPDVRLTPPSDASVSKTRDNPAR